MTAVVDLRYAAALAGIDRPDAHERLCGALTARPLPPGPLIVGLPSTWGGPRIARLAAALAACGAAATPVPRAVLIAASHADAAVQCCAVVETVLLPAAGDRWSVQLVRRRADGWTVADCAVVAAGDATGLRAVLDGADLVIVAGPDIAAENLPAAVRAAAGTVRVAAEEPALTVAHGARCRPRLPPAPGPAPPPHRRGTGTAVRLATAAAALTVIVTGVGLLAGRDGPPAPDWTVTAVGPARFEVPGHWRRTELPAGGHSGEAGESGDGGGRRTVFADRDDGRRIVAVVTRLRRGSDRGSVADSLAQRIGQRGDDVVVEFAAAGSYAGREVISYREAPVSGPAVRWYVIVDADVQVSLGCQDGTGEAGIDPPCRRAVGSVRVAPA